jgi:hypothetical protein
LESLVIKFASEYSGIRHQKERVHGDQ